MFTLVTLRRVPRGDRIDEHAPPIAIDFPIAVIFAVIVAFDARGESRLEGFSILSAPMLGRLSMIIAGP